MMAMVKRFAFVLLLPLAGGAASAQSLDGTYWKTEDKSAVIGFAACDTGICGRIVGLVKETNDAGKPLVDANNPDPAKRRKPIIGLITFFNIAPTQPGNWNAISYDPREGEEREITLQLQGNATLIVKGCGLGGLICKSFTWTLTQPPVATQ